MTTSYSPKPGQRVSFEETGNPRRFGRIAARIETSHTSEFMVRWEDGTASQSDLRQHGWRVE